jgi:predicted class III extradiol MEMO1 family dioxygenase
MSIQTDEDEHSIEMHLPYVRKVFEGYVHHVAMLGFLFRPMSRLDIAIVPILVGAIDQDKEANYGRLLAPYLARDDTFSIVSSDFCHWLVHYRTSKAFTDLQLFLHRGTRFSYTFYYPDPPPSSTPPIRLSPVRLPATLSTHPIHESISALDHEGMDILTLPAGGAPEAHEKFTEYLARTKNTICGRHPIGILLGALADMEQEGRTPKIEWVRYEQSSRCVDITDSSVSYASAYVVF